MWLRRLRFHRHHLSYLISWWHGWLHLLWDQHVVHRRHVLLLSTHALSMSEIEVHTPKVCRPTTAELVFKEVVVFAHEDLKLIGSESVVAETAVLAEQTDALSV